LVPSGVEKPVRVFKPSSYFATAFDAGSKWLAVAEDPDVLQIVSLQDAFETKSIRIGGKAAEIDFMPDGHTAPMKSA
jgi:hypothetical protein